MVTTQSSVCAQSMYYGIPVYGSTTDIAGISTKSHLSRRCEKYQRINHIVDMGVKCHVISECADDRLSVIILCEYLYYTNSDGLCNLMRILATTTQTVTIYGVLPPDIIWD